MDADFGAWRGKISQGLKQWDEWDKMTCDHMELGKEAKCSDLLGTPLDYMESCEVFKSIKMSEYDLCHFYRVGLSGDFPEFPTPHEPATNNHMCSFLEKAWESSWPNLIVAHSQDAVTAVCLLQEIHANASLQCLKMETDAEASGKTKEKLSFCPFCQYSGSNDSSYLNYIICVHYNASHGCGKCLKEVFPTGQWLRVHMEHCKGLKVEAAKDKPATSHAKGASSSSSNSKKKKKHQTKSQQPDLQPDSQTLPPTSSKASSHISPHHSGHDKPKIAATTPKKSHSSSKDSGEKHSLSHKYPSKKHKLHKSDKHQKKK